jgi:hypothetical protein
LYLRISDLPGTSSGRLQVAVGNTELIRICFLRARPYSALRG